MARIYGLRREEAGRDSCELSFALLPKLCLMHLQNGSHVDRETCIPIRLYILSFHVE